MITSDRASSRIVLLIVIILIACWVAGCSSSVDGISPTVTSSITEATSLSPSSPESVGEQPQPSVTPSGSDLPDCPDGVIIFSSVEGSGRVQYASCPDGSSLREISSEHQLSDPDYLAIRNLRVLISSSKEAIIIESLSGEEIVRLEEDPTWQLVDAALSYDGQYVAYGFIDSSLLAYGLGIVHLESETRSIIFEPDAAQDISVFSISWLRWSPDSYRLLIYGGTVPTQVMNIRCDADTHTCQGTVEGDPGKFTNTYTVNPWSPDGNLIVYPCYTAAIVDGEVQSSQALCVQDSSGQMLDEYQEEVLGVSDITSVHWAPDSQHVVFAAYEEASPNSDIFVLSVSEGILRNLTADLPGSQDFPVWLP